MSWRSQLKQTVFTLPAVKGPVTWGLCPFVVVQLSFSNSCFSL